MCGYLIDMDGVIYRGTTLIPGGGPLHSRAGAALDVPFRFFDQQQPADAARTWRRGCSGWALRWRRKHVSHLRDGDGPVSGAAEAGRHRVRHRRGGVVDGAAQQRLRHRGPRPGFRGGRRGPDVSTRKMLEAAPQHGSWAGRGWWRPTRTRTARRRPGTRPGCGAIVAMLEAASGVKAFSVGKPSPVMLRAARKELGLTTDQTIVIGDTMDTDHPGRGAARLQNGPGAQRRPPGGRTSFVYAYRPDKIVCLNRRPAPCPGCWKNSVPLSSPTATLRAVTAVWRPFRSNCDC